MKEWYQSLEQREKRILLIGAVTIVVAVLYLFIWEPFIIKMHRLQENTLAQSETIAWMQTAIVEAKLLQSKAKSSQVQGKQGESLLGTIDRTAKSGNLGGALKRVQPDGEGKARVWLENAKFNDIVQWLEQLQRRQGIHVETGVIERQSDPGIVNARVVFIG